MSDAQITFIIFLLSCVWSFIAFKNKIIGDE